MSNCQMTHFPCSHHLLSMVAGLEQHFVFFPDMAYPAHSVVTETTVLDGFASNPPEWSLEAARRSPQSSEKGYDRYHDFTGL